ncbi:RING-type domain-containing protein [Psidium guajava]|nr:RING-type domain-containing protein [Psidium guajava]
MWTDIVISVVLLLVGIAVLVVIHLCMVGRLFRERYRSGVLVQRVGAPTVNISSEDLDNLPCFDYAGGTGDRGTNNGPVDCPVCLESFKVGEKCRSLPSCNHGFHAQCIDSWLLKTPICPICRTRLLVPSRSFKHLVEEPGAPGDVTVELT